MAIEEGHFSEDLDVEQFAWSMYSYVLGYHHFKRMLEDPKAELHLRRAFEELIASARKPKADAAKTALKSASSKKKRRT